MNKSVTASTTLALLLAAASPAVAAPNCFGSSGFELSFGIGFQLGDDYTEQEQNDFDKMRLRSAGVDTDRVERWNGCLRAFTPEGMRFFDPGTLEEVY